jgi:hypothetical protein
VANNKSNVEALNQYNKNLKIKNRDKVKDALDKMLANSESVNIAKLAKTTGLARSTIYRDAELRAIIDNFRETSVLRKNRKVKFEKEQSLERAASAKLRVLTDKLKEERKLMELLRQENTTLKEHIEYITQKNSQIKILKRN